MRQEGALHLNRERRTDPWRSFQTEAKYVSRQDRNMHSFRTTARFFFPDRPAASSHQDAASSVFRFTRPFIFFCFFSWLLRHIISLLLSLMIWSKKTASMFLVVRTARCTHILQKAPLTTVCQTSCQRAVSPWLLPPSVFYIPVSYSMIVILNWEVFMGNATRECASLPLIHAFFFSTWRPSE